MQLIKLTSSFSLFLSEFKVNVMFPVGGVPVEASDARCTHLVVEDSVTELPSGLLDQSHCQAVKQEVSDNMKSAAITIFLLACTVHLCGGVVAESEVGSMKISGLSSVFSTT